MSKNRPRPPKNPEPELEILQEEEIEAVEQEEVEEEPEETEEPEEEDAGSEDASDDIPRPSVRERIGHYLSGLAAKKTRLIFGILFFLAGALLLAAMVSHFLCWWKDFDLVQRMQQGGGFSDNGIKVRNWVGGLGAYCSYALVNNGFGVAALIIPVLMMMAGLQLLLLRRFHWLKIFFRSVFALLWISTLLGCFLKSGKLCVYSGDVGLFLARYLRALTGWAGLAAILLFSLLCYLVFNYNIGRLWNWLKRKGEKKVVEQVNPGAAEPTVGMPHQSSAPRPPINSDPEDDPLEGMTISTRMGLDHNAGSPDGSTEVSGNGNGTSGDGVDLTVDPQSSTDFSPYKTGERSEPVTPSDERSESEEFEVIDKRAEVTETATEKEFKKIQNGDHIGIDTPYDPRADLSDYKFPGFDLLDDFGDQTQKLEDMKKELQENKDRIVDTLRTFGIEISKISATIGPTVTLYEIVPAPGIRIGKIKNLEEDIALSLAALGIRIIAPIPGKGTIGIEVPNNKKQIVPMRDLLTCAKFGEFVKKAALPVALGKTISNEEYIADLAKMPHLLVAGATGQGKSVGLNAIISSLLYSKHPSELKFVLVDPKKVEFSLFNKIERHYLAKLPDNEDEAVITDNRKVVRTLNSLCVEMDNRYLLLKDAGVRKIDEYNKKFCERKLNPTEAVGLDLYHHFLPYIVLIVDEFADLIMTAGKEVELPVARLAQLARAVGIHLVIATQRPSVNVITGMIKANFPARIAFKVQSQVDSRTILDTNGANQLIGRGDMLISAGDGLTRLQCALIDTPEVERIAEFIGEQRAYPTAFLLPDVPDENAEGKAEMEDGEEWDPMFREAAELVVSSQQASTSMLQRKFKLGYNRAGRIMDQLEVAGVVSAFNGQKIREVKVKDPMALEEIFTRLNIK